MNQRGATARFIGFEQTIEEMPGFAQLKRRRPIAELQLLAGVVWVGEKGRGPCPIVRPIADAGWSLWEPNKREIQLVPAHRNAVGLLHEMAHALGPHDKLDHGPAFCKRAIRLYRTYGDWDGVIAFDRSKGDY